MERELEMGMDEAISQEGVLSEARALSLVDRALQMAHGVGEFIKYQSPKIRKAGFRVVMAAAILMPPILGACVGNPDTSQVSDAAREQAKRTLEITDTPWWKR